MKDKKYSALDEWVRRAGEGDQTAREMLLMSFKPLIYKQAAKYRHPHDSLEDAVQYGGVVLLEAAADYPGREQPALSGLFKRPPALPLCRRGPQSGQKRQDGDKAASAGGRSRRRPGPHARGMPA